MHLSELLTITPGIYHWMILSTLLFGIGVYGLLTRRNAVGVLIAIEILLNAAALNFVVANHFLAGGAFDGEIMAIFIIATAAAEIVVAMAILVTLFRHRRTLDVTHYNELAGKRSPERDEPFLTGVISPAALGGRGEGEHGAH